MSQDDLTDELNAYLAVLEKARGRSAKAANRIVNRPPQTLVSLATAHGLEDDQVNAVLAAIITMPHERIAVRSAVLLVPRRPSVERASAEAVVEAVTRLPAGVRAVLTRWLLTCHDLWSREVKQLLHDSYAVWFGLVERAERAELCRLLYLLTRRADVTPWRAKILSAVMERDLDPAIIALAELYARFAPSWVKFPALKSHATAGLSGVSDEVRAQLLANMRRDVAEETSPSKRPRVDAHERTPVAVQQLDGPLDLARELAAGVDVVRGSADPTRSATARYLVLLQGGAVPSLAEAPLSDALVDFVEVLQVMPEELEPALYRHLQTWNGASTRALSLLATLRPCRFDQLHLLALAPLAKAFSSLPGPGKYAVVTSLSLLHERWMTRRWEGDAVELARASCPRLQAFVERLCLTGLVLNRDEALVTLAATRHLAALHSAWSHRAFGLDMALQAPLPELCARLAVNPTVMGVDGAAAALAKLVPAFKAEARLGSLVAATQPRTALDTRQAADTFKAVANDFAACALLGRPQQSRLLSGAVPPAAEGALGVERGAVFAGLRAQCEADLERPAADVAELLRWLEAKGVRGVAELARQAAPALLQLAAAAE